MKLSIVVGFALFGLHVSSAFAAIPKAQVTPARILNGAGVAMGGTSGPALALMDFRRSVSKKNNVERFVLDFGSADLKETKGLVGYYHAELQDNPSRFILELPQTFATRLPEKEILKRLQNSLYVRQAKVDFDRNLQSMTLIFQLKQNVQAKVVRVDNPATTGKIVIDFRPEVRTTARQARPPAVRKPAARANAEAKTSSGAKSSSAVKEPSVKR